MLLPGSHRAFKHTLSHGRRMQRCFNNGSHPNAIFHLLLHFSLRLFLLYLNLSLHLNLYHHLVLLVVLFRRLLVEPQMTGRTAPTTGIPTMSLSQTLVRKVLIATENVKRLTILWALCSLRGSPPSQWINPITGGTGIAVQTYPF